MICDNCQKQLPNPNIEHRQDKLSGLTNLWIDTKVTRCSCGEVFYEIPNSVSTMEKVVIHILKQSRPLTGEQIRFLRGYLHMKGVKLAKLLGTSQATIYRYEADKLIPKAGTERLIRLICAGYMGINIKTVIDIFPKIQKGNQVEIHVYEEGDKIIERPISDKLSKAIAA